MESHTVTLAGNETLLEAALRQDVDLAHDCGGTLACVSCQVVVRQGADRLRPPSEDEIDLLDRAGISEPGARLACQAVGTGEMALEIPTVAAPVLDKAPLPVTVTAKAAAFFARQLTKHPGAAAVRLAVRTSGCSGFRYAVDPAEQIRPDDNVFESHGVRVVVDAASLPHLQGTTLDIVQDGLARRLDFSNPNATQTCGCGESFGTS
jgi:iron-sulfur cluster assembly protein